MIGNTLSFARDAFGTLESFRDYDAEVVEFGMLGRRAYALTHPDAVEQVLVADHDDYEKAAFVESQMDDLVGDGLIVAEGDHWQRQRGRLQPAFFRQRVLEYAPAMVERGRECAADWTDGDVVDVRREMMGLTLRVLVSTVFDMDIEEHVDTFESATSVITDHFRPTNPSSYLPTWVPTPNNRRYRRAIASLEDVIAETIAQRRARDDPGTDMLGMMLTGGPDGEPMGDTQLRDELMTMLLAGHETTALALTFAIHELAGDPEVQQRLQAEVDALGGDPTADDLDSLSYTETVVDEAMRLYPPINLLTREPTTDVTVAGYEIPEGSFLVVPQWTIHRDDRWFDDPLTFDPERWLGGDDRPEFAYFPFGGGPRRCIGAGFATVEAKLLLATLVRRFAFERTSGTSLDLTASLTTRPKGGVDLRVRRR